MMAIIKSKLIIKMLQKYKENKNKVVSEQIGESSPKQLGL